MSKIVDKTGRRFGRLVVLRMADDQTKTPTDTTTRWLCRCDCGNEVIKSTKQLRKSRSCGCLRESAGNAFIDLTGQRFGKWTVVSRADNAKSSGNARWLCRCECGAESVVPGTMLRSGRSTMCRACAYAAVGDRRAEAIDLTGQRFGRLIAQKRLRGKWYQCICDCGNIVVVETGDLTSGNKRSCGCLGDEARREGPRARYRAVNRDGTNVQIASAQTKSPTGVRGVYEDSHHPGRYIARLRIAGKDYLHSRFATFEAAVAARKQAEKKYLAPLLAKWDEEDKPDKEFLEYNDLLTTEEAAVAIEVRTGKSYNAQNIVRMIKAGYIPGAVRLKKTWCVPRKWAEEYLPRAARK